MANFYNMIVANFQGISKKNTRDLGDGRVRRPYTFTNLETEVKAQIDNSLEVGWKPEEIMLVTNFSYQYKGVSAILIELPNFCMTGSKTFAMNELHKRDMIGDKVIWLHDLDVWQNEWFDLPEFKEVGIATYSRPKFNGGSVFYRPEAKDMIAEVVAHITKHNEQQEEPTINKLYKQAKYNARVTIVNSTYNLGCSGFQERYNRAEKPIKCCHFHPNNKIAVDTHLYDRNLMGNEHVPVCPRLKKLLFSYFPILKKYNLENNGKKAMMNRQDAKPDIPRDPEPKPVKTPKEETTEPKGDDLTGYYKKRDLLKKHFDAIRPYKDEPQYKIKWELMRKEWKQNEGVIKYLEAPEQMYNDQYYKRHFDQYRNWEISIAKFFSEKYKIQSVLDFGCGVGSYLEGHVRAGVTRVNGIEYNYNQAKNYIPDFLQPHVKQGDATKDVGYKELFDCVWSVEVAEHILPEGTDGFITNLVNNSNRYIMLTAAPPGQAGTGHINLRPKQYWIEAIEARGFDYLAEDVENLQVEWNRLGGAWYVVRNLMLFKKR